MAAAMKLWEMLLRNNSAEQWTFTVAILIAVLANSVVKAAIATIAGGPALGWRLAATFAAGALAGGLAFWLAPTLSLPMP